MTTLQRSAVSFRRQGSSGRIWDDLHLVDPKTGQPVAAENREDKKRAPNGDTGEENLQQNKVADSGSISLSPASKAQKEPERKSAGCGFSAIFGRCKGS